MYGIMFHVKHPSLEGLGKILNVLWKIKKILLKKSNHVSRETFILMIVQRVIHISVSCECVMENIRLSIQ